MQKLERLTNRILYLPPYQETDRPVLGAVLGDDKTVLIDAGNSSNHARLFLSQLEERHISADLLVLTHWHWDHVFGMSEIQTPIISHRKTYTKVKELQDLSWEDRFLDQRVKEGTEIPFCADAMKKELGTRRDVFLPSPDITFDNRLSIHLGGVTCVIEHVGGDHSNDSCIIYIPEEKVLFLGDCMYANLYSKKWSYTLENTLQLIQRVEKYDADFFVLSHHDKPLTKEAFHSQLLLFKSIARLTEKCDGDQEAISRELSKNLSRGLNEDDIETISFFVNGYLG
ncbi:glyoxylase-like metal-dependent hydrolase (beta-lactamase superfamily II) [Scopulibacillus darangshiensis]|uniref:Glyoxylase-like metal-dependent hydrolase (Beta-lactamase superfamily II) n=1 Tax=Scopulibacillus darangshiensis TaxID=442528 RepID=A0A4R2NIP9_9BACL|nr:MBL fold metallo-hydrolase [Scopulibacillus darangshiensis]TCP21291.1 glyoxylase-like metal-dependent hydrolase (beta-lactamase superfamily II) [Scopulibacillus darangshiensis]